MSAGHINKGLAKASAFRPERLVGILLAVGFLGGIGWMIFNEQVKPRRAQSRTFQMQAAVYKAHEEADAALVAAGLPKSWMPEITLTDLGSKEPVNLSWSSDKLEGPVEREKRTYKAVVQNLLALDTKTAILSGQGPACAYWTEVVAQSFGREKEIEAAVSKLTPEQRAACAKAHQAFENALEVVIQIQGGRSNGNR